MRRPFVLRVHSDDPMVASGLAQALVAPLKARGARVVLDGEAQGGAGFGAHIVTATRGLPGASVRIGVWDEVDGARWLAPLDVVDADPARAAGSVMTFLETWGFVIAPPVRTNKAV